MLSTEPHLVTYAASTEEVERCARTPMIREVLLEPALLACQGTLSPTDCVALARLARSRGLRPVLVWDILLPQRVMQALQPTLAAWAWEEFAAVRVADIGAAQWLRLHQPHLPLQLIVETGNHNEDALRAWCTLFAPALERLVLSIELPEERLIAYARALPVPCEIMGVGRILLFYSPRTLLAPLLPSSSHRSTTTTASAEPTASAATTESAATTASSETTESITEEHSAHRIEAISASDLSGYRPLPVLETAHGTYLYLDKDQFILDRLSGLLEAGFSVIRLDVRHLRESPTGFGKIDTLVSAFQRDAEELRKAWPRPTRAPFFKNNKTTAQFTRLKANHHEQRDEHTLAEVVGVERRRYVVLCALRPFSTESLHALILPSGEEILLTEIPTFHDLQGIPRSTWLTDQLLITERIRMACPGALLQSRRDTESV